MAVLSLQRLSFIVLLTGFLVVPSNAYAGVTRLPGDVSLSDESVAEAKKQEYEHKISAMALEEDGENDAERLTIQFGGAEDHRPLLSSVGTTHVHGKKLLRKQHTVGNGPKAIVVSPSYGPTSGGVWVQVMGAGSYHTPNSLQCKLDLVEQFCYSNHYFYSWCYLTPKCAGVYPFHCHNGPLKFEGKYAVVAKTPWVTSVYPFSGDTSGGTAVTVRGWNFEPHCPQHLLCKFGDVVVPAKYYTSSSIMCISPCNPTKGFVSVEVSNDGGNHWSMSGVQYGYVGGNVDVTSGECRRYTATTAKNPAATH
jgi:hypothetical protein